jgi:hypothetical protein
MEQLLFLALILACPLMMMLMMRGSHGGHGNHMAGDNQAHTQGWWTAKRIAELERQVSSLHARMAEHDDAAPAGRK